MFFCPGSIGLLNDDDESDWDIDNIYNHSSSIQSYHQHHSDADSKFSKMGSLMFVVVEPFHFIVIGYGVILQEQNTIPSCSSLELHSQEKFFSWNFLKQ